MRDSGGRKPFRKNPTDAFRKKKSGGDFSDKKKSFGSKGGDDDRPRKRFSGDKPDFAKKSSSDRPYKKREDGDFKKDKSFGERKFGDKPFAKKSFGSSDRGEKKFGDKPFAKKSFGNSDRGEKKFGDKPFGKKPFANKEGGERRFDDKPFAKKSYGNSDRGEKKFGDKPFAKKSFGEKKSFGDKPDYAKRNSSDKPFNRSYKGQGNSNKPKNDHDEIKDSTEWQVFGNADEAKEFIKSSRNEKKTHSRPFEQKPIEYKNENRPLKAKSMAGDESSIRLNRFIANTGICSRREADDLITAGVVKVNGKIVTELGTKITPSDTIHYGDQLLRREKMSYVLLNKPKDYITTTDDPQERKTVMHLIESAGKERIYPVGRLDRNTTGLLLFTNDGDLAERLTHPKYGIRKIYHVSLDKNLRTEDFDKILAGITMEDGFMQADELSFVGDGTDKKEVGIVIHSGRNRIVRRLFEGLGYDVVHLDRVVYAGLTKKNLPRGRFRHLTPEEVGMLRMQVGGEKKTSDKRFGKSQLKGKGRREKK